MRRDFFPRTVFDRVSAFQIELSEKLSIVFDLDHIVTEWSASIERGIYSPRLDLAIGPFAMDESLECEYDQLLQEPIIMSFLRKLQSAHVLNLENNSFFYTPMLEDKLRMNLNARCLVSIEIENQVTQKHLIGGIVNASALGRVGILIPWNERQLRAFIRTLNYLGFLKSVGKNTFDTTNLFIITQRQIEDILESIRAERMGIG